MLIELIMMYGLQISLPFMFQIVKILEFLQILVDHYQEAIHIEDLLHIIMLICIGHILQIITMLLKKL